MVRAAAVRAALAAVSATPRPCRLDDEERLEVLAQRRLVGERKRLRLGLQEEVERIEHGHVGNEIDHDHEPRHLLRKHEARQEVAVRILLPVQEVAVGLDPERVAETGVRLCGAGRRRMTCGPIFTRRSYS